MNILSNTTRCVLEAPDGVDSLEGFYPNGPYTFTRALHGRFSFYAPGPEEVDLTTTREATFAYTVLFPEGFDWVKGGNLPGFCTYTLSLPAFSRVINALFGSRGCELQQFYRLLWWKESHRLLLHTLDVCESLIPISPRLPSLGTKPTKPNAMFLRIRSVTLTTGIPLATALSTSPAGNVGPSLCACY